MAGQRLKKCATVLTCVALWNVTDSHYPRLRPLDFELKVAMAERVASLGWRKQTILNFVCHSLARKHQTKIRIVGEDKCVDINV